ncbi:MAG: leucyl aminopeptidase family protein, partial [Rhodobacteraceae bacterium]|nr:leucyl aminopeptidase family protein [Paracoccaceae bacterium]
MTNTTFTPAPDDSLRLFLVSQSQFDAWKQGLDETASHWIAEHGFKGQAGRTVLVPDASGRPCFAAVGMGTDTDQRRSRFRLGGARATLPKRHFHLGPLFADVDLSNEALGWLLAGYKYTTYAGGAAPDLAHLSCPDGVDCARLEKIAHGECLTRDLINTPANDMGPPELEAAALQLAERFGAKIMAGDVTRVTLDSSPFTVHLGKEALETKALI